MRQQVLDLPEFLTLEAKQALVLGAWKELQDARRHFNSIKNSIDWRRLYELTENKIETIVSIVHKNKCKFSTAEAIFNAWFITHKESKADDERFQSLYEFGHDRE